MFKRVLVATDLTELSAPAVRLGATLGREDGAVVVALNVAEEPERAKHWLVPFFSEELVHLRGFMRRQEAAALERLRDQVQTTGADVTCLFRWGNPAEIVVAEAKARGVDLVILGTSGSPLGSVAERVVRTAECPILVVPGPK